MRKEKRNEKQNSKVKSDKHQSKSQKETFLQWYERDRRHSKLSFMRVFSTVLLLIVCVVASQEWAIAQIGDGASKYSESTYDELKNIINENFTNVAIDEKAIREKVDHYDMSYTKGGDNILRCDLVDGFFTAEARVYLDIDPETGDYVIIGSERNYHSVDEFLDHYWFVFRLMGYGIGIGAFLLIIVIWRAILFAVAFVLKKIKARKEAKSEEGAAKAEEKTSEGIGTLEEESSRVNLDFVHGPMQSSQVS